MFSMDYWLLNQNKSFHLRFVFHLWRICLHPDTHIGDPVCPLKKPTLTESSNFHVGKVFRNPISFQFFLVQVVSSVLNCSFIFWVNVVLPHRGKFGKENGRTMSAIFPLSRQLLLHFLHICVCSVHSDNCGIQRMLSLIFLFHSYSLVFMTTVFSNITLFYRTAMLKNTELFPNVETFKLRLVDPDCLSMYLASTQWTTMNHLKFLYLSFLICKMGILLLFPHRVVLRIKWSNTC